MGNFFVAAHTLICKDSNILITRRSEKNDYKPFYWDIPGGTVKIGETPYDALLREIDEETSITIEPKQLIYVYTNLDQIPVRQRFQMVFLSNYVKGDVSLNPEEHDDYKWVNPKEFHKYSLIAFLDDFLKSPEFKKLSLEL